MRCPPLPPGGDEVLTLFGAVRHRAVHTVKIMLFVPSERARASIHKVGRSRASFTMFGPVRLRVVWAASHELFVHFEGIRAITQGVYIFILCHITVTC